MSGGGPGPGRTRISVNLAALRERWLIGDAARCAARLGLPIKLSHLVRAAIEHFARLSDDERTALVARYGGDGVAEAGTVPAPDR